MNKSLRARLPLLGIIVLFAIAKYPHLFYPYYWDESWPYAPAVVDMAKHGISLIPGAVQPELSRGHPLLFHALAAVWGSIFGFSHVAMHSFALTVSLLFMVAIYEVCLRLFNIRAAVMALLLVCTQTLFFVQSSYLLLELLLAFMAFMSLYHYIRGNYIQTAIYLSALFYTKESGLIMGFVLGVDALFQLKNCNKMNWKQLAFRLLSIGVPCVLAGVFFLLQKHINGWYVLPLYSGLVEHSWSHFWLVFSKAVVGSLFLEDNRYWQFLFSAAVIVVTAISKKMRVYILILLPIFLVYFMSGVQGPKHFADSVLHFSVFILSMLGIIYLVSRPALFPQLQQRKFILLGGAFILCFMAFSAMNFLTYRYMLTALIPLLCIVAVVTEKMTALITPWVYFVVLSGMLGISAYGYSADEGYGDTDRGGFAGMKIEQAEVDFLERNGYYQKHICGFGFLFREHVTDPATGFLRSAKTFSHVNNSVNDSTDIVVFDNIELQPDNGSWVEVKNDKNFKLLFSERKWKLYTEIYARRDLDTSR